MKLASNIQPVFVTFEGPEGAGKSTAMRAVADGLRSLGHDVFTTREPGDGVVGASIREILLHGEELDSKAELLLFLADRAQHVSGTIRPALVGERIVLCDRYSDSTVVYQAHARGLDAEYVRNLNEFATGGLIPDLTLLLDIDPEAGLARIENKDRLDDEPLAFHRSVREGFLVEMRRDPGRWELIDAQADAGLVADSCLTAIKGRLGGGIKGPF